MEGVGVPMVRADSLLLLLLFVLLLIEFLTHDQ